MNLTPYAYWDACEGRLITARPVLCFTDKMLDIKTLLLPYELQLPLEEITGKRGISLQGTIPYNNIPRFPVISSDTRPFVNWTNNTRLLSKFKPGFTNRNFAASELTNTPHRHASNWHEFKHWNLGVCTRVKYFPENWWRGLVAGACVYFYFSVFANSRGRQTRLQRSNLYLLYTGVFC